MIRKAHYYPHIDGLRALSISLVILFHYEIGPFTGGFIGVDIFFTISGFLIIGAIVTQQEKNEFKLIDFWLRRLRRLMPVIAATLLLTYATGFLLMNPVDLSYLSRQSLFALFSLINFTLLKDVDYFDLDISREPLIHFWSLAVEEQFYLLFPFLALFLFKKSSQNNYRVNMLSVLVVLSIISLTVSELIVRYGDSLFAYYMMPTRFIQLAMGGVLAVYIQSPGSAGKLFDSSGWLHDAFCLAGFIIIILISVKYDLNTAYPGLNAIWPTLAAMVLLLSGGVSRFSAILENAAVRYVGKISFTLYLIHWPVWSYMNYYYNRALSAREVVIVLLLTLFFSVFIYHFIENPIRFSDKYKGRKMFKVIRPMVIAVVAISVSTLLFKGFIFRLDDEYKQYGLTAKNYHKMNFGGRAFKGNAIHYIGDKDAQPDFVILGDSKARQFAVGMDELLTDLGRQAVMVVHDGCPFMTDVFRLKRGEALQSCADITIKALEIIEGLNLPVISLRSWTANLNNLLDKDGNRIDLAAERYESWFAGKHVQFHKKIRELISNDREIYLIGGNEGSGYALPVINCLSRPKFIDQPCFPKLGYSADKYNMNDIEVMIENEIAEIPNTYFVKTTDLYCPDNYCGNLLEDNRILYSDSSHLSVHGSRKFAPILLKITNMHFKNEDQ